MEKKSNVKARSKWECGPGDKYRAAQKCANCQNYLTFLQRDITDNSSTA